MASDLKNIKLHYFTVVKGSPIKGRGEFIRLLLEDSGVDFEYVRYTFDQWVEQKEKLQAEKVRSPTMPYITVDGKYYGKTFPSIRFLVNKLGQYGGRNDDEVQLLDAYTDTIVDWMTNFITYAYRNGDADTYLKKQAPLALKTMEDILSDSTSGPYILGDYISYTDFLLYHALEEDGTEITSENYPHIHQFIQAMENRPNLKKYLATDRH